MLLIHQQRLTLLIVAHLAADDNEAINQTQTKREELKMKKVNKTKQSKKGYTLVELIVVIAIIVIIASVVAFNYIGVYRNAVKALDQAFGCETSVKK